MSEPHKIVLILGNGFDLDLGLKTSYKDFWESDYCPKHYPAPLIHYLNQCWPDNLEAVKWYDLENELMQYYLSISNPSDPKDFITEDELEFLKTFESYKWEYGMYNDQLDLVQSLVDKGLILIANRMIRPLYVPFKNDLFQSPTWRDRKALQLIKEGLCKYLNELKYEKESRDIVAYQVFLYLATEREEKCSVAIYSFNYTNVNHFIYSAKDVPIHYMHGRCSEGKIVIGTRDVKELVLGYDFLQKSFDSSFSPPALVADLQTADEVVIFGHSIGENDRQYFKAFFIQQTNFSNIKRKDITVFTKDGASELQIKRSLENMTDWNLLTLFGLNNLQFIKTGAIKEDQNKLFNFLVKHGKADHDTRDFIGNLLAKEQA